MKNDPKSNLSDLFPLPKNIKRRTPKFGANPVSPLFEVPLGGDQRVASGPRPEFKICWEDPKLGVRVVVREQEDGRLIADVLCTYAGLLDQSAVSVGLMGAAADHVIPKAIPLNVPDNSCRRGSADFGPLTDVVKELGSKLGVVVFLLV